jgi:hypothetical protein
MMSMLYLYFFFFLVSCCLILQKVCWNDKKETQKETRDYLYKGFNQIKECELSFFFPNWSVQENSEISFFFCWKKGTKNKVGFFFVSNHFQCQKIIPFLLLKVCAPLCFCHLSKILCYYITKMLKNSKINVLFFLYVQSCFIFVSSQFLLSFF